MTRYVSVDYLADRYDVGLATIWRWARLGLLPKPERLSAKCTRWDLDAIERIEEKRGSCLRKTVSSVCTT